MSASLTDGTDGDDTEFDPLLTDSDMGRPTMLTSLRGKDALEDDAEDEEGEEVESSFSALPSGAC
jgi:hypothetical protein